MTRFRQITGGRLPLADLHRVLLIQLGDIGDVALSLPCIDAITETIPNAEITMLVRPKAADLLLDHPDVFRCITPAGPVDGKPRQGIAATWAFLRELRRPRFDLVIDLRTGTRGAIAAFLSGARHRASLYANNEVWWRNRLFTHLAYVPYALTTHIAEHYLNPLRALGFSDRGPSPRLPIDSRRRDQAHRLFEEHGIFGRPLIAMQASSLWAYKELPEANYAVIARDVMAATGGQVILVGSAADAAAAGRIVAQTGSAAVSLAGRTPLGMLPAVLAACDRFVGIDSAGLHIAGAVGTPTIGIFGPSAADSWMPRGEDHQAVTATMDCIPCRRKGCDDSGRSNCLIQLDPHEVVRAVCRGLSPVGTGGAP